ncbi:hypothetical protein ACJX0J_012957, partial [Zea mays]
DTFVISLEDGHYVVYIKRYMTDEDVVVSDHLGSTMLYATLTNKYATLDRAMINDTCFAGLTDILLFLVYAYDANLTVAITTVKLTLTLFQEFICSCQAVHLVNCPVNCLLLSLQPNNETNYYLHPFAVLIIERQLNKMWSRLLIIHAQKQEATFDEWDSQKTCYED